MRTSLAAARAIGVALAVTALSGDAAAVSLVWDNGFGDNDWFNSVNWDPDDDPDPSDDLTVSAGSPQASSLVSTDDGGSITIDGAGASATFNAPLYVGNSGTGTLDITNGGGCISNASSY